MHILVAHAVTTPNSFFFVTKTRPLTGAILLRTKYPDPSTDGLGGSLVVSGDDDDSNSRLVTFYDGVAHFRTGRVQHSNHTHKCHISLRIEFKEKECNKVKQYRNSAQAKMLTFAVTKYKQKKG